MSSLHPALRRWEPFLEELSPALRGTLSLWLPRLNALVGAHRHRSGPERGDPDGYDGFASRGTPDRLALSEWALREIYPDEFLRRAIAGEQLFLRPAHRVPQAARRALVLFDSGPAQLGAARAAHLALLVVLTERARRTGGLLSWAVLQRPGTVRVVDLPGDLGQLALARSWSADVGSAADWRERTADIDDLLVVGGPAAGALAQAIGAEWLRVEEADEALIVGRAGGPSATLPIDDRGVVGQALHAPLASSTELPVPRRRGWFATQPRTLRFSPSGGHLLVELASGGIAGIRARGGRSRRGFRPKICNRIDEGQPVAATVHRKQLVSVWVDEEAIRVVTADKVVLAVPEGVWPALPQVGLGPAFVQYQSHVMSVRYVDGAGVIRLATVNEDRVLLEGRRCLAFEAGQDGNRALVVGASGWVDLHTFPLGTEPEHSVRVFPVSASAGFIGPLFNTWSRWASGGALAVRGPKSWWLRAHGLSQSERQDAFQVPAEAATDRVVGVTSLPGVGLELALLVLEDQRRLVARTATAQVHLLTLPVPALNAALSADGPRLAYALADGTIGVRDLESGATILSIEPGSGS